MFLGDIPGGHQTDLSFHWLPDRGHSSALLHPGLLYVDVDGSVPSVPDFCESTWYLRHQIYPEVRNRGVG